MFDRSSSANGRLALGCLNAIVHTYEPALFMIVNPHHDLGITRWKVKRLGDDHVIWPDLR